MSSPLRPLTVILAADHGGAYREIAFTELQLAELAAQGFPNPSRRYWDPEAHGPEGTNPIVILDTTADSYDGIPRTCRFCSCPPAQHAVHHPRLTIGVNPSLVMSVTPLSRTADAGVVIVRMTYHKRATNTLPGMLIGYGEEFYLVAGTVESVLAQLAWAG